MTARVLEASFDRLLITVRVNDYDTIDGEFIISIDPDEAQSLMHALEAWKDER